MESWFFGNVGVFMERFEGGEHNILGRGNIMPLPAHQVHERDRIGDTGRHSWTR